MERDYEKDYQRIMEGLAESVLEMSDEEILAEVREAGKDPSVEAERVRDVLRRALAKCQDPLALDLKRQEPNNELSLSANKPSVTEMRGVIAELFRTNPNAMVPLLNLLADSQIEALYTQVKQRGLLEVNESHNLNKRSK